MFLVLLQQVRNFRAVDLQTLCEPADAEHVAQIEAGDYTLVNRIRRSYLLAPAYDQHSIFKFGSAVLFSHFP